MTFTARAPYPPESKPDDVPSFARELADKVVVLTHPSGDVTHPNLIAAERRYLLRGWTVRTPQRQARAA